jgi:hypothetical protein
VIVHNLTDAIILRGISNMIHVKDILDIDRFWDEQLLNVQKDRLFGCSIDDSRGTVNGKL